MQSLLERVSNTQSLKTMNKQYFNIFKKTYCMTFSSSCDASSAEVWPASILGSFASRQQARCPPYPRWKKKMTRKETQFKEDSNWPTCSLHPRPSYCRGAERQERQHRRASQSQDRALLSSKASLDCPLNCHFSLDCLFKSYFHAFHFSQYQGQVQLSPKSFSECLFHLRQFHVAARSRTAWPRSWCIWKIPLYKNCFASALPLGHH